jgi:hypothetical protein
MRVKPFLLKIIYFYYIYLYCLKSIIELYNIIPFYKNKVIPESIIIDQSNYLYGGIIWDSSLRSE